jgi:hypothetical protein
MGQIDGMPPRRYAAMNQICRIFQLNPLPRLFDAVKDRTPVFRHIYVAASQVIASSVVLDCSVVSLRAAGGHIR